MVPKQVCKKGASIAFNISNIDSNSEKEKAKAKVNAKDATKGLMQKEVVFSVINVKSFSGLLFPGLYLFFVHFL